MLAGLAAFVVVAVVVLCYLMVVGAHAVNDLEGRCSWEGGRVIPLGSDTSLARVSFWPPGWQCEAVLPTGEVVHGHAG